MIKNELISYNHNTCYNGSTSFRERYNIYKNKGVLKIVLKISGKSFNTIFISNKKYKRLFSYKLLVIIHFTNTVI